MSTSYFDTLPIELARDILQNVDCLPHQERQATLRSLCLTSKLLRSHAQPLLLKRIYTSIGVKQDLLKLLVENNASASLATVQALIFDVHNLTKVSKWLKQFAKKAVNLQEVFVNKQVVPLKAFIGSNITTLSLYLMTIKLDGAVLAFPELVRLSLNTCSIHNEGGIRFSLPKLRHFAFIGGTSHLWPQEVAFFTRLIPHLVSFTISLEKITSLPPSIRDHPTIPIFFTTWWTTPIATTLQGARHLMIPICGPQGQNPPDWTDKIKSSAHQLETLTIEWSGGSSRPEASVTALLDACKAQNIEVLWEHRPDPTTPAGRIETFFDLVPSSFVRRSEARQASK